MGRIKREKFIPKKSIFKAMILVTGGTGLVGAHLLAELVQKHTLVRATRRANSDLEAVRNVFALYGASRVALFERIEWVEANILDLPSLEKAINGINRIYHCAAYISLNPQNYRALRKANVEGTANVVNLALAQGIEKLCYVSSIAVLGSTLNGAMVSEETHWNPEEDNSVYAITKYGAEMEVWRGVQEGLKAVIVNPGIIMGEGFWTSGSGAIVRNASKGGSYYTPGASGFVDVQDVVKIMVQLMESECSNERFVLVAENWSYRKLQEEMSKHFGNNPPTKVAGKRLLGILGFLDRVTAFLFGTKRKLPKPVIRAMINKTTYDSSKILAELNFKFKPMKDTIQRVVSNYSS